MKNINSLRKFIKLALDPGNTVAILSSLSTVYATEKGVVLKPGHASRPESY